MLILQLDVVVRTVGKVFHLGGFQLAHLARRAAGIEISRAQALPRSNQCAGCDDNLVLHDHAVHYHGSHAHENAVADTTTVQRSIVPYGDFIADDQRPAIGVERPGVGDMQNTAILHAGPRPDPDTVHVAAHSDLRPDRDII